MATHSTTGQSETLADDHPLVERVYLDSGTVLAGRYRIGRLIGEGGMGDVYLAEHLKIGKEVAIKVLAPEQMRRPRTVARFLQEAKAASMIRHDNVVDITDYGESDGCAFFVMEYLAGEDLSFVVKREGRLPWARIKPIAIQLLEALAAAHAVGIIHRDIKPHNCFLTPRSGNPDFVKMIDFGIAKLYGEGSEEQLTRTGAIVGTAEYMSPEQGLGEVLDGRSDLYSVGIILYRMLTGAVPYDGNNPMAVLYQHIHAERVPPSKASPEAEISSRVDALVLKAIAKDRDDRFESAGEFIEALEAIDDAGATRVGAVAVDARRAWWPAIAAGVGVLAVAAVVSSMWGQDTPQTAATSVANANAASLTARPQQDDAAPDSATPQPTAPGTAAPGTATADAGAAEAGSADGLPPTQPPDAPSPGLDPSAAPDSAALDQDDPDQDDTDDDDLIVDDDEPAATLPARRPIRSVRGRLGRIDGKVRACGKKAGLFPGESVRVVLTIAPGGRVQAAKVKGTVSRSGARCVEKAVRSTRFSAARRSQTVEHTFKV